MGRTSKKYNERLQKKHFPNALAFLLVKWPIYRRT